MGVSRVGGGNEINAKYLIAYFQDQGSYDDERLYFGVSPDGNEFRSIGRVTTNGIVRDPSILPPSLAPDGKWHIACTNHTFTSTIPNNTVDIYTGTTPLGLSAAPAHIDCSAAKISGTVNWAWAPEWFKDSDATVYLIISTSTSGQTVDFATFTTWALPATNSALTTFGTPINLGGLPTSGIDCYIVKRSSTYYAFIKSGTIKMYTATGATLTAANAGGWTLALTDIGGDAGNAEGPNFTDMGGGTLRLYYDKWSEDGRIKYADSTNNLTSFGPSSYVVAADRMRHASIIDVSSGPSLNVTAWR